MASLFGNTIIQTQEEKSSLDRTINQIIDNSYKIELNAFYRAFVANNVDPLKLGRVQVRIPSIHGTQATTLQTPTSSLPWAAPGIWNCAGNDMGQYLVPEVGTLVFVTFEQGDQTKPIYFGGISNQMGNTTKYIVNPKDINKGESYAVNTNDYPEGLNSVHDKLLFKSAKGNEVVSSDLDGKEYMYLVDASGQSIEMENFGPYLKRRGSGLGFSGKPRMKLTTNRGSNMVLTNEAEIMTSRNLQGQLDDIKILNKTDDLSEIDIKLNKLLRDRFKDFGNYSYNANDKVFNLDVKLNDVLSLTETTEKVFNYQVKIFNEFEFIPGLFLQVNLIEKNEDTTRVLINYRNTNLNSIELSEDFYIYFVNLSNVDKYKVTVDNNVDLNIPSNLSGNFYATIDGINLNKYEETWGFDYREEFRFIVDTTQIPTNDIFTLDFGNTSSSYWRGYIKEIVWGDGESTEYTEVQSSYTHDYKKAGSYKLSIKADSNDFKMPYTSLKSRGIVSIESPLPINGNSTSPIVHNFGYYSRRASTLVHINKYLLRNYLLSSTSISLRSSFEYCSKLKSIPEHLLDGFENILDLEDTFNGCKNLKYIPEDLFEGKDLSAVTSLVAMFYDCTVLETIPDFLFDNETLFNVEDARSLFEQSGLLKIPKVLFKWMSSLKYVDSAFSSCVNISYIPKDLLKYNSLLQSADYLFLSCSHITEIPRGLFKYNRNLTSLYSVFKSCIRLEKIPSDLFSGLTKLTDLRGAFMDCSGLNYIEKCNKKLFSDVGSTTLDISSMFKNCVNLYINIDELFSEPLGVLKLPTINISGFLHRTYCTADQQSTVPSLWNIGSYFSNTSDAFGGTGNSSLSITNYNSIPSGWK